MDLAFYILAILYFTLFDVIGYHYILTKKETIKPSKKNLVIYRVIQGIVQISLYVVLYLIDFKIALMFALSHWFGLCDMLYYIFLNQKWIYKFKDITWLWWTPYGLLSKVFNYKVSGIQLTIFSIIIFVVSILVLAWK